MTLSERRFGWLCNRFDTASYVVSTLYKITDEQLAVQETVTEILRDRFSVLNLKDNPVNKYEKLMKIAEMSDMFNAQNIGDTQTMIAGAMDKIRNGPDREKLRGATFILDMLSTLYEQHPIPASKANPRQLFDWKNMCSLPQEMILGEPRLHKF